MYTYTFQAELNGEFVPIPEELRNLKKKATFVVVMPEEDETDSRPRKFAPELFIPTKGFKFNREEANER